MTDCGGPPLSDKGTSVLEWGRLAGSRRCVAAVHHLQTTRVSFGANAKGTKLTRVTISLERKAMPTKEGRFQAHVIHRLRREFPGCEILRGDANFLQGISDLILLWREHWAALELKTSANAKREPNQEYYRSQTGRNVFRSRRLSGDT